MNRKSIIAAIVLTLGVITSVFGQEHTENKSDQTLHSSGRVNPSTLGMEIDIPLGSYPGRGINVPIALRYSSKLWRMNYSSTMPLGNSDTCSENNAPVYSENSASGWTTSLAVPYIEYTGSDNTFNAQGQPSGGDGWICQTNPPPAPAIVMIKRITVHLPSGETHELRDETANASGSFPGSFDGTFYAADGSNIKYVQNSSTGSYRILMPDGSFYNLAAGHTGLGLATIRKATQFTDRNGNFTSYNEPTTGYPNGYWTDTLGRIISVPFGLSAPAEPTTALNPQVYSMPGMTGTYKFHWKKLKDTTAAESGLTDFSQSLRYWGDKYLTIQGGYPHYATRDAGTYLFGSVFNAWAVYPGTFNPIVLTQIELPTGQSYKFSYDIYGKIENISYPTGGEEKFEYEVVPQLSGADQNEDINAQTNFGVKKRQVYQIAGQGTPYEWNYTAAPVAPNGYQVTITNPDSTRAERYLYRSLDTALTFGYDTALAGMAYDERSYSSSNQLISQKLTNWTVTNLPLGQYSPAREWHPRVTSEESRIYDNLGSGVSATTTFEYEGDLTQRNTPVLMKKSSQYAFVTAGSQLPSAPVRTSESIFLINDTVNYPSSTDRDAYKAQNMVGLVTVSKVGDGAKIVAQSEMKYDESGSSPAYRGNPTTARVWDSTKGLVTDANAYIPTHAKFDTYGNQTETIDAKGNSTLTEYDAVYQAYPVKVTTAVPDPNPTSNPGGLAHGSQTAFITTATFNTTTGLPLTTTDANGQTTTMEYDAVTLHPKKVTPPSGAGTSETFYHDEPNNYWVKNKTQIDTNKWAESITYFDGLGRAVKSEQIDSQGNIFVEKEFDADGRVLRVTNSYRTGETKYWTTNVYDEASRVKEVILPDTSKVKTDYGVSASGIIGITKQITDQAGRKRKGITDALGRMVRVIEDPGSSDLFTNYTFDTLGNLRKTEQGSQSRYFSYDSLGRLLRARQPEQDVNTNLALPTADAVTGNNAWTVKYAYDDNGNITSTTDAKNATVTATYDKFNRLIFRDYSDTAMPDVHFYYDGTGLGTVPNYSKGKTTKVTSSISETRYTSFDNLGRLLTSEQRTTADQRSAAQPAYTSAYTYNLSGALVTETYPSGRVVTNQFDQDGDLANVSAQKQNLPAKTYLSDISYNSAGAIQKMRLGNGRWESAVYNERMQVMQIALGNSNTDKSLLKIDYSYTTTPTTTDNNGSLREQKISYAGLSNQITQSYTYDALNRLQSATEMSNTSQQSWKQTFQYDRYGNRRFDTASNNTTTLSSSTATKITNPDINTLDNRFKKDQDNDTFTDYDYDANGNLILDAENKRFVYDAENHQTKFFLQTNSTTTPDATYEYDGEGKRVRKISGQTETIFVYNGGGNLVAEYATQISTTPQVNYLTADHLGSSRIITDGGGMVVARHDYMAFGNDVTESIGAVGGRATSQGYNAPEEVRQGYTGYEKDDESGLDFAQARYYNSAHGRFTSIDPLTASASIKNPQTFNRYSYALNSPYKFTDPLGLLSQTSGSACGQWCANSGPYSDGSGFRGRDTTFTSFTSAIAQTVRPNVGVAGAAPAPNGSPRGPTPAPPEPPPPPVDLRSDKVINAGLDKIRAAAKPLAEGESPVLSSVEVIVGETYNIKNGTFIDAAGTESLKFTGVVRPVAYIPLDQNGNVIPGGNGIKFIEKMVSRYGELPNYDPRAQDPPSSGFIIDIQSAAENLVETKLIQSVGIGQNRTSSTSGIAFSVTNNEIIKNAKEGTIDIKKGNTVKIFPK